MLWGSRRPAGENSPLMSASSPAGPASADVTLVIASDPCGLCLRVLHHDCHRLVQLGGWAELDRLGAWVDGRYVSGGGVVGAAGLDHVLAVRVGEGQSPLEHNAPVGRLAAVVGQAPEQGRHVAAVAEVLEGDRVVAQFVEASLVAGTAGRA